MEIRIREDGSVVTDSEFRAMHPNTSFGPLDAETLDAFGADVVLEGPQPSHTLYQYIQRDGAEEVDGQWFTKWIVVDMNQAEKDAVDAHAKAGNADRAKRELVDTDWCENASVRNVAVDPHLVNGADFDAYRLALRAIVIDPPVTVDPWPSRPSAQWTSA